MNVAPTVLVVDDRRTARSALAAELSDAGFRVVEAGDGVEGWERFTACRPDVVITDVVMPASDGMELLTRIRAQSAVPVVMFSAYGSIEGAVSALKAGADDFVSAPEFEIDGLVQTVRLAIDQPRGRVDNEFVEETFVGRSPVMRRIKDRITALAPLRTPVLVSGEPGTGRDLVVRSLHQLGDGAGSELVVAGPYDDPDSFEGAASVYVDGLEEIPAKTQSAWLRYLLAHSGRSASGPRFFASSIDDATRLAARHDVSQELARLLARFEIGVPALRDRLEDLPSLVQHLCRDVGAAIGRPQVRIVPDGIALLEQERWPGNVRQLRLVLERAIAFSHDGRIDDSVLSEVLSDIQDTIPRIRDEHEARERGELIEAIRETGGNITRAAELLEKSRGAVYRLITKHGIPLRRP